MLYRSLQALIKIRSGKGGGNEVVLPEALFLNLVREALRPVVVDEEWYLERNPDVRQAIEDGRISSPKDHFRIQGYFEGRLPAEPRVDEHYYLRNNPDIAQAVQEGKISSVRDHFFNTGCHEGRVPHGGFSIFVDRVE